MRTPLTRSSALGTRAPPPPRGDGDGRTSAGGRPVAGETRGPALPLPPRRLLSRLAVDSPPAFICHYYNFYFAHTAGGRMIGQTVSRVSRRTHTRATRGEGRAALPCAALPCLARLGGCVACVRAPAGTPASGGVRAREREPLPPPLAGPVTCPPGYPPQLILDDWTGDFYKWEGDVKVCSPSQELKQRGGRARYPWWDGAQRGCRHLPAASRRQARPSPCALRVPP